MTWNVQLGGTARSPEDVEALHALGLEFAEVPISRVDRFEPRRDDFAAARDKTGLFFLCHGPREGDPNNIQSLRSVYFPRVMQVLSVMPHLGMKLLTVHLWLDPRFVTPEAIRCKVGILEELIQKGRALDVDICLENLSETHAHLEEVFRALPLLHLTLDIGHGQLLATENTSYGFLENYPERILHVHIHDNRGGNSPEDDLHLPVGEGIISFQHIFGSLKRAGYKRTITLELRPEEIGGCLGHVRHLLRES